MNEQNATAGSQRSVLKGWLLISRVPFLSVGVLPFVLGGVLAARDGSFSWPVFLWGLAAVVLIMLVTYYNGEYFDFVEDELSGRMERNAFTGGSQAVQQGLIPRWHPLAGSVAALAGIVIAGLVLVFGYGAGPWAIPLGVFGLLAGFFYSVPPLRWVGTGFGELLIGVCYGWLPVAASYYIQRGSFEPIHVLISIPVGLTIFNVILINEFPDYPADVLAGKRTLTVRIGKEAAGLVYVVAASLSALVFGLSLLAEAPARAGLAYLPVFLAVAAATIMTARRGYLRPKPLERICAISIVANLGTTLAYVIGYWPQGS